MGRIAARLTFGIGLAVGASVVGVGVAAASPVAASGSCYSTDCAPTHHAHGLSNTPPADGITTTASTTPSSLAFTGADVGGTAGAGVVLIGGGVLLVRASRRRRATA